MKITKTLTTILIGTVCMTALCGCSVGESSGSKKKDKDKEKETEVTEETEITETSEAVVPVDISVEPVDISELPQGEVLIHTGYTNEAEGYQARDIFVMSDGSVYMSEEFFGGFVEEYCDPLPAEDRLQMLKMYTAPVMQFDLNSLAEVYTDMQYIDPDAEFVYDDDVVYDGGYSYIELNIDGEWLKVSEGGVYRGGLEDAYAEEAVQIIRDELADLSMGCTTHVYSKDITFLKTYELRDADVKPCKMLITNMDELKEFEEMTGIDLKGNECFEYFGNEEYDAFNSMCIAVEIVAYDEVFGLDTVSTDAFLVSDNYVGFCNLGLLKMATTDLRLGTDKYYCYVAQVPAYDMSVYEGFEE